MTRPEPEKLRAALLEAERGVWDALVAGDHAADEKALAEDFLGAYPSGFSDKAGHVGQLKDGPSVAAYRLSEIRTLALGEARGLLAYRADYRRAGKDENEAMLVSSIWERRGGMWINVFSQDTPLTGEAVP